MSEIASRMMRLFGGFSQAYGTYDPGRTTRSASKNNKVEIKTTAKTVREPLSVREWSDHLEGVRPLGVIPIRDDSTCVWGCVDVDRYDISHAEIAAELKRHDLPLLVCRSKSGGAHLFMFLIDPQPASDLQAKLKEIAAALGFGDCEIFPKQTQVLVERGDVGNWLNMPYFGGDKSKNYCVKSTVGGMTVEEFAAAAETLALTGPAFEELSSPTSKKRRATKAVTEDLDDGPPCLQHMATAGFPGDFRNNSLFALGTFCKKKFGTKWQEVLERFNQKYISPPATSEDMAEIIKNLDKKDYNYRCKDAPICTHCDAPLCRTRKFGVGGGGEYPMIAGMSVLDTDPPIWFLDVDGERVECSTDELQDYRKFQKKCMNELHVCYRMMKSDTWLGMIGSLMESVIKIEAPPEVGVTGHFRELLEDFCKDRHRGETKEDILGGKPWESEEERRYYFRLRDLMAFLKRERFDEYTRPEVVSKLKEFGGDRSHMNLKGVGVSVWWVPDVFGAAVQLNIPKARREPI